MAMSSPDSSGPSPARGMAGWKIAVLIVLLVGIVGAVALRMRGRTGPGSREPAANAAVRPSAGKAPGVSVAKPSAPGAPKEAVPATRGEKAGESSAATPPKKMPKLLDLGAGACVACKMMEPVLDELRREYRGKLDVQFIDVWKNPDAAKKFGIRMIPTQIFFGPDGKELWRHVGFISKDDIVAKWKELGVEF